jgi:lipoyl(octanoyl) transferase
MVRRTLDTGGRAASGPPAASAGTGTTGALPPGAPADVPRLDARWLGTVSYGAALALQAELVRQRRSGAIPDTLLLLEHPHVITLGTSSHAEHVLADAAERARRGIELHETGRGGDVTYHGPGQLVGYPILDLKPDRCDLHRYVRDIEAALIDLLAMFDIQAGRAPGWTGVWTGDLKIAAIGVRVSSGWITSHGFALNVCTDLSYFDAIVPCGIRGRGVTSMAECIRGHVPSVHDVGLRAARAFARTFGRVLADDV